MQVEIYLPGAFLFDSLTTHVPTWPVSPNVSHDYDRVAYRPGHGYEKAPFTIRGLISGYNLCLYFNIGLLKAYL